MQLLDDQISHREQVPGLHPGFPRSSAMAVIHKWMDRQAHNLKVVGSNPTPATNLLNGLSESLTHFLLRFTLTHLLHKLADSHRGNAICRLIH